MTQTAAQNKANAKYKSKTYDTILLRLRKDTEPTKETIAKTADKIGVSVSAFIQEAITEKIGSVSDQNIKKRKR